MVLSLPTTIIVVDGVKAWPAPADLAAGLEAGAVSAARNCRRFHTEGCAVSSKKKFDALAFLVPL
jgi:hypothetical protein